MSRRDTSSDTIRHRSTAVVRSASARNSSAAQRPPQARNGKQIEVGVPYYDSLEEESQIESTSTIRFVWDLWMVFVAVISLYLVLWDISYLALRPLYIHHLDSATRVYDHVKGIEPHPLTSELLIEVDSVGKLLELDPKSRLIPLRVKHLRNLTARVLVENPFERSGQSESFEVMRLTIAQETGRSATDLLSHPETAQAAAKDYWSMDDQVELRRRLDLWDKRLRSRLKKNYFRQVNLKGRLMDKFWMIELPFLVLFWLEFFVRWIVSLRNKEYAHWYIFPIMYWYDLLGLVPNVYFRGFRLFRAVSMYLRLRRSEISRVGMGYMTRGLTYILNIITEEVSEMVCVRVINESKRQIRDGTHLHIMEGSLSPRRDEIKRAIAAQIHDSLTDPVALETFRVLLLLNLETAVDQSKKLEQVPLPSQVKKPMVRAVGGVVLETTVETLAMTLDSKEGQKAVEDLVGQVIDQLVDGPGMQEFIDLATETSLEALEQLKERLVITKKWNMPKVDKSD